MRNSTKDAVDVQLTCELEQYSLVRAQPIQVKPGDNRSVEMKVSFIAQKAAALRIAENSQVKATWTVNKPGQAGDTQDPEL